jgi:O-antigen/teichoic acid export membrane protein
MATLDAVPIHRKLQRLLPKGRFARRLMMLAGSTAASQALLVLVSPLLTRMFSPEDFGVLGVFAAITSVIMSVIGLRYEFAIPVCRDDGDTANMMGVGAIATVLVTLLVTLGIWAFGPWLAAVVDTPSLAPLLWFMPPTLLVYGLLQPIGFWSIRQGTYRMNAMNRMVQSGAQAITQALAGLAGTGSIGLVGGYCLSYLAQLISFLWTFPRSQHPPWAAISWRRMAVLAREHWHYPVYSTPSSLLQITTQLMPTVLFAALYGPAVAGLFGLGQRIVGLPVKLVGTAASQAYVGEIGELPPERIYRFFMRTSLRFAIVGLLAMLPFLLGGPWLFQTIFGPSWTMAGTMVQFLVPQNLARFVLLPVSQTLNLFKRQDLHLVSAVLNIVSLVGSMVLAWWLSLTPLTTVLIYSLGSTLAYLVYFLGAWHVARVHRSGAPVARAAS